MCHRIYGKPISVNREDDGIIMLKSETLHGFFPQTKSQRKLIKTISVTYSLIIEVCQIKGRTGLGAKFLN